MKQTMFIMMCGALTGILIFSSRMFGFSIGNLFVLSIIQMIVFVICHELNHGISAQKNGLKFSVLYLGPFTFKRENEKFKLQKGTSFQGVYLGRCQIDNGEILNEEDYNKHLKAWDKAIEGGPLCDLVLSISVLILALIFKSYYLLYSTLFVNLIMCIPSYIMGDGKHIKQLKKDKVFASSIIYTYSIIGNSQVSNESKQYLINKLKEDIENQPINEETITGIVCGMQMLYQDYFNKNIDKLPNNTEEIVNKAIEYKKVFLKQQIEQTYFKGIISTSIIDNVIFRNNKERALELYNHTKKLSHKLPGEKLELYRVEHVLGIQNREEELNNDKYMNPIFKGCEGIYKSEKAVNDMIINYIKSTNANE